MTDSRPAGVDLIGAVRARWWLVALTPLATVLVALGFVLLVSPSFESTTSLRFTEDQSPFGGSVPAGLGDAGGGLSLLASLAGGSVPIQTEMAVLRSRALAGEVVDALGLRVVLDEPDRTAWTDVFRTVQVGPEALDGEYELEARGDGFSARGDVVVARDPFRPFMNEEREVRDYGTVAPGGVLNADGLRVALTPATGAMDHIVFEVLPRAEAIDRFLERVVVSKPDRDADIVDLTVEWEDPVLAARIAGLLTQRFMERREEQQAEQFGRNAGFLQGQLDSLQTELGGAEERLRAYRESEGIVEPEAQATAAVEQLAELQARRDLLASERRALLALLTEIRAQEPSGGPTAQSPFRRLVYFPTLLQNTATAEMLRLLGELENDRAALFDRRGPEAREVQVLNERIRDLEGQLRTVAETYLDGLQNQVASLNELLEGFSSQLARVPAVELEYLRRRRQVEVLNQLYVFMEVRQKEAEVTAAGEAGGVRVVDPPMVPIEPVSPKPALTLGLGLVVGLILGVAGAVVLDHAGTPRRQV